MIQNKEYSEDPLINKKLYEIYLETIKEKSIRNDANDLIPIHVFEAPLNSNNYNPVG